MLNFSAVKPKSTFSVMRPPALSDSMPRRSFWSNLHGSSGSLAIAAAQSASDRPVAVIASNSRDAEQIAESLTYYCSSDTAVTIFPSWECLPYDHFSPHQDILSQRVKILSGISILPGQILIVAVENLMQRLPPVDFIQANSFVLKVGMHLDLDRFCERLHKTAYRRVLQVELPGEYALRGAIVDLYPMGSALPIRIELLGEAVDTLRRFAPETQLSIEKVEHIEILPGGEVPLDAESIRRFRQGVRQYLDGDSQKNEIYNGIDAQPAPPGTEYYLPLFFDATSCLADYLSPHTVIFTGGDLQASATQFWNTVQERFQIAMGDESRPPLPPQMLYLNPNDLKQSLRRFNVVQLDSQAKADGHQFDTAPSGAQLQTDRRSQASARIAKCISAKDAARVLFVAENPSQRQTIKQALAKLDRPAVTCDTWQAFLRSAEPCAVCEAQLAQGAYLGLEKILIVSGAELFGRPLRDQASAKRKRSPESIIASMEDLSIGEPVVHEQYGIGRYQGLTSMTIGDSETEFMTLEYRNNEKLYVPIYAIDGISRYIGGNPETVDLHSLSSKKWGEEKTKARKKAYDIAAELLQVQSLRESHAGIRMQVPEADYAAFAARFPYQETPDQLKAIDTVMDDLRSAQPMDRIICGDVGFGKTEIAMRAALVAVASGYQVAVVVPTTLLAQQHYEVFRNRFIDLGVEVELISRMVGQRQVSKVKSALAAGAVDIAIGTHQLLQPSIRFAKLGLFIVDEEHRFGVRQKEYLKKVRANVDMLTMTATPIPRTLSMALNGFRDISLLATPPDDRLSVRTFVDEWKPKIVREAILRELSRGGQIFYLHNKVKTISYAARELKKFVPEANISIAHGQMPQTELDQVMRNFYAQKFDTLVCSTIIESGIDIPTANTIIVNHASNLGLAQLHQLRGRVGRSHHQAYAYFLVASREHLTGDAKKRLESIAELDHLGVGYLIATHDMEIRGAGSILGEEQSGTIDEVGYRMYAKYLDQAIKSLKDNVNQAGMIESTSETPETETQINVHTPAFFPNEWIASPKLRLALYRRIAGASDSNALNGLKSEVRDRFGPLPPEAEALFQMHQIKLAAKSLGLLKLDVHIQYGQITFAPNAAFSMAGLKTLVAQYPGTAKLNLPDSSVRLKHYLNSASKRYQRAMLILNTLGADKLAESNPLAAG